MCLMCEAVTSVKSTDVCCQKALVHHLRLLCRGSALAEPAVVQAPLQCPGALAAS